MSPILVTGAAGRVGGVGRGVVELLRQRGLPVRAFVHREDARATRLRALGAEVAVGDLTSAEDLQRALDGIKRIFFSLSVSPEYLQATATTAVMARSLGERELFLNMSQMTVSQMSATQLTGSPQHTQQWMAEQVLDWSGLPVVHLRPTVFLDNPFFLGWAAESIAEDAAIRLPFGTGRTSPVAVADVARVAATILADPGPHVGRVYELTGPRSEDMRAMAEEYSGALGRPVRYVDVAFDQWQEKVLRPAQLPEHLVHHLATMARLHAANRYDRLTNDVETITGRPATTVRDFIASRADLFARPAEASARA
jgi:NAD(P)H dehydrogenase (quinone)